MGNRVVSRGREAGNLPERLRLSPSPIETTCSSHWRQHFPRQFHSNTHKHFSPLILLQTTGISPHQFHSSSRAFLPIDFTPIYSLSTLTCLHAISHWYIFPHTLLLPRRSFPSHRLTPSPLTIPSPHTSLSVHRPAPNCFTHNLPLGYTTIPPQIPSRTNEHKHRPTTYQSSKRIRDLGWIPLTLLTNSTTNLQTKEDDTCHNNPERINEQMLAVFKLRSRRKNPDYKNVKEKNENFPNNMLFRIVYM